MDVDVGSEPGTDADTSFVVEVGTETGEGVGDGLGRLVWSMEPTWPHTGREWVRVGAVVPRGTCDSYFHPNNVSAQERVHIKNIKVLLHTGKGLVSTGKGGFYVDGTRDRDSQS